MSVYVPSAEQWQVVRGEVAEAGAPESALSLVDQAVANEAFDGENVLALVTTQDQVLVEQRLDEGLVYGRASWAPIADLVPLLKARQEQHPSVATSDDPVDVATAVAVDTVDCLEEFKQRLAADPSSVADGIHATTEAITNGKVDVLLVRDDRDERQPVRARRHDARNTGGAVLRHALARFAFASP